MNNYSINKKIQNIKENDDTQANSLTNKKIEMFKKKSFIMNRKERWILFVIFTLVNLLNNFDHGTIPASTNELRNYLGLSDSQLGIFGSLVFLGVMIGSLFSLTIINIFNRKYILLFFLILQSIFLFIFTTTKSHTLLFIDRVIIGIFQAFLSIYLPLWCEQFGIENKKTLMMAIIQAICPMGVLVGYLVTTLLNINLMYFPLFGDIEKKKRWTFSFYIQSFLIFLLSLYLLLFPDTYFDSKSSRVPHEIKKALNIEEEPNTRSTIKSYFYKENQLIDQIDDLKDENNSSKSNKTEENSEKLKKSEVPFPEKVKIIFSEPLFILGMITLSGLYFIVTCIQYWASDYMLVALDIRDETKRLYGFATVCLTSPTLGLLLGGYIVDKLGGYRKKGALVFCFIVSIFVCIPAIPLPMVNSLLSYACLLWLLLFFGAQLIPPFQGIIIACLPKNIQGSGNSFLIFLLNVLGYSPAPFAYGFLKDYFDDKNDPKKGSRMAHTITIYIALLGPVAIGIATLIRFIKEKEYNVKMGRDQNIIIGDIEELYANDEESIKEEESNLIEIKNIDQKNTTL